MRIKNSKLTLYIFSIYLFVFISCESEAGIRPPQEENMSLEDYESSYNIIQTAGVVKRFIKNSFKNVYTLGHIEAAYF